MQRKIPLPRYHLEAVCPLNLDGGQRHIYAGAHQARAA